VSRDLHWNYYLALEDDVRVLSRYVEFAEANFETYSIELAHVLFAATAEIDVLLKRICRTLFPGKNPETIRGYFDVLGERRQYLVNQTVNCRKYGLQLSPWNGWTENQPPTWWTANNKVKHARDENFHKATLESALNAMAALLVANVHSRYEELLSDGSRYPYDYRHAIQSLRPLSDVFRIDDILAYLEE